MASCERCWRNAGGNPERYAELVKTETCTPEQQAGTNAGRCPDCGRMTIHQYCCICMNPLCSSNVGLSLDCDEQS